MPAAAEVPRDARCAMRDARDRPNIVVVFLDDIGPLLTLPPGEAEMPPFVFAYSDAANRPAALRSGPWKLHIAIRSQTGDDYGFEVSRETPLLFHLKHDIGERIDRAAERPDLVESLLAEIDAVGDSL